MRKQKQNQHRMKQQRNENKTRKEIPRKRTKRRNTKERAAMPFLRYPNRPTEPQCSNPTSQPRIPEIVTAMLSTSTKTRNIVGPQCPKSPRDRAAMLEKINSESFNITIECKKYSRMVWFRLFGTYLEPYVDARTKLRNFLA